MSVELRSLALYCKRLRAPTKDCSYVTRRTVVNRGGHSREIGPGMVRARTISPQGFHMDEKENISRNGVSAAPSKRRAPSVWEIYFPHRLGGHQDSIYVASFPPIMYFWPTIVALFLCAFLQGVVGVSDHVLGWLAVLVLVFNLLVLVQDFDQKKFVILLLLVVSFTLVTWIVALYGFTFFQQIATWFLSFDPRLSTDAYLLLGFLLLALFLWGIVTPLFSYWRLEQNEFVHFTQPIGKDMSIARTGCTIYKEIPDVIECLLGFGAGTLIIRKDNQVLATIPHIPFLGMRMDAIEHMLSETRVIVDTER